MSKAVDKCFGKNGTKCREAKRSDSRPLVQDQSQGKAYRLGADASFIEPESEYAKQWKGWGTALKPANEPIVLARKPLEKNTVAKNVLKWGTGGINVDAGRIGYDGPVKTTVRQDTVEKISSSGWKEVKRTANRPATPTIAGRFPANVLFDEQAAKMLDEQSGESRSVVRHPTGGVLGHHHGQERKLKDQTIRGLSDHGGASRFFYVAKTSKHERNYGLDGMPEKQIHHDGRATTTENPAQRHSVKSSNHHPTVKPFTLMRYLVRLITPPGGTVLDPFLGSGTTGAVSVACGFKFVGIEREKEYFEIAKGRIKSVKLKTTEKQ